MKSYSVTITASIVLHNEDFDELNEAVQSFLAIPESKKLFLIDNGSTVDLKGRFDHPAIRYLRNEQNLGFAKGHNLILSQIRDFSEYHLILNPDVAFNTEVIGQLLGQMNADQAIGLSAPRVVFPNGELQYTARKYPGFFELIYRRLGWFSGITSRKEYRNQDLNEALYPDFLHGCFLLFRTDDYVRIGGFDERYFLYMEDIDICRKLDQVKKKKLYYPKVEITHVLKKASSRNLQLFVVHFNSAIKYFKKWGFV